MICKTTYGLILAGGQSKRMGRDKAVIEVAGQQMVQYPFNRLKAADLPVIVSCRRDQQHFFPSETSLVFDRQGEIGPMAGLCAAFSAFPEAQFLVLPCDMPTVSDELLRKLLEQNNEVSDIVLLDQKHNGRYYPFPAIYHPSIIPKLQLLFEKGEYSMQKLIEVSKCHLVEVDSQIFDLRNINDPHDLSDFKKQMSTKGHGAQGQNTDD